MTSIEVDHVGVSNAGVHSGITGQGASIEKNTGSRSSGAGIVAVENQFSFIFAAIQSSGIERYRDDRLLAGRDFAFIWLVGQP
jgi:uncharacterized protein YukJ